MSCKLLLYRKSPAIITQKLLKITVSITSQYLIYVPLSKWIITKLTKFIFIQENSSTHVDVFVHFSWEQIHNAELYTIAISCKYYLVAQ